MLVSSGSTVMAASVAESSSPEKQHFTGAVHWSWDLPEPLVTRAFFLSGLVPQ